MLHDTSAASEMISSPEILVASAIIIMLWYTSVVEDTITSPELLGATTDLF